MFWRRCRSVDVGGGLLAAVVLTATGEGWPSGRRPLPLVERDVPIALVWKGALF